MTRALSLGIDIGTTSTKVAAVDRDGTVVGMRGVEHDGLSGTEIEPDRWWASVRAATRDLGDVLRDVVVVGLCGNMSSLVLLDEAGSALRPAMLLADGRGAEEIERLDPAVRAEIESTSGNAPATVFTLAKLLWVARHEPEVLRRADVFLTAKDYVRHRLTGTFGTEPTDAANTLLLDPETGQWREDLIESVGLVGSMFPVPVDSASVVGSVTPEAAAATGLPEGVAVQAGMGDMAAAMLGAADPEPGTVLISLGTSVTTLACVDRPALERSGGLTYHPLPRGMGSMVLGSMITGGLAVNWLRSLAGSEVLSTAPSAPDPHSPLVFLPHLSGAGTPEFRPEARGAVVGLDPSTTGVDLARALYAATAFELADTLRLLAPEYPRRVVLAGGGTRLPPWVRIIADVLERPVDVLDVPDSSVTGAARLAWRAQAVDPLASMRYQRFEPRAEYRAAWREQYRRHHVARRVAFEYYASRGGP